MLCFSYPVRFGTALAILLYDMCDVLSLVVCDHKESLFCSTIDSISPDEESARKDAVRASCQCLWAWWVETTVCSTRHVLRN